MGVPSESQSDLGVETDMYRTACSGSSNHPWGVSFSAKYRDMLAGELVSCVAAYVSIRPAMELTCCGLLHQGYVFTFT